MSKIQRLQFMWSSFQQSTARLLTQLKKKGKKKKARYVGTKWGMAYFLHAKSFHSKIMGKNSI